MKASERMATANATFFSVFVIVVSVFMITELDSKLQSAEARCKVLEKQLDYMRKMVENAKKERYALKENQVINIQLILFFQK